MSVLSMEYQFLRGHVYYFYGTLVWQLWSHVVDADELKLCQLCGQRGAKLVIPDWMTVKIFIEHLNYGRILCISANKKVF